MCPSSLPSSCSAASKSKTHPTGHYDSSLATAVLLGVVMMTGVISALAVDRATAPPAPTPETLNPNLAPWWELTALPRVGPSIAHRIVQYRRRFAGASPVGPHAGYAFTRAADLLSVSGIGPQTMRRIGPYLSF
jgi:DNA uptake protein ComE-like DNA-binding protein